MSHERRQAGRAGALGDGLLDVGVERHRPFERSLLDQHDVFHQRPGDGVGEVAHLLDRDALGDGLPPRRRAQAAHAGGKGRIHRRLDPEHPHLGLDRLGRRGAAGNQAAAADGDEDDVQVRAVLQHLGGESPLPGHHFEIVEGVHQDEVELAADGGGMLAGLIVALTVQHHLGAELAGMLDLHCRRRLGHDDGHRHPQPMAVIGQGLGVVAGRGGDHPALALLLGQSEQLVQGPTLLEGGGELKVLELDEDLRARDLGQGA